ncbi:Cys-tRNA(Pro) deacylase, prolyl-tRNA editing enzyme YbaK/EbsC [Actinacidiphila yanglinensis]|uniref:Cys-tRNA(Pro) deacylase, prolyl-tRNA editing enzyme YbaK/EbsC n=1 Tax=Actinacidiphila yanglinensis TaxID=310779 RepID=A0A1H6CD84_9ACTN|nr:YbaK/EbsC family protein [Actinacidiphila yanglinensis]SEG70969.1 Cys-tRNA(Pro) deacylase, prolyl-tRNA editing enzyme YbaK/EbsC [Actinacidiphila yanglinensis]
MRAPIGPFEDAQPATERRELLPPPVAAAVTAEMLHVDTDPAIADTADFVATYGQDLLEKSANCVVVAGKRGGELTLAACVVLSTTRVDVNGTVRRHLGARKASFASMDTAVSETGMEYGGITPVGLPAAWPLLVDAAVVETAHVVIGSGARRGKLIVPGKMLATLPGAVVLDGLGA